MAWRRALCRGSRRATARTVTAAGMTTSTTTTTGTATSDTSVDAAPTPTTLSNYVATLSEKTLRMQRVVQQHTELLQLQSRQHTSLEHRLAALEAALSALQSELVGVKRSIGEVVMQQGNVDVLLQQMERARRMASPSSSSTATADDVASHATHDDRDTDAPAMRDALAQLERRVSSLCAYVDTVAADRATAKVDTHNDNDNNSNNSNDSAAAAMTQLQRALQGSVALPYEDATTGAVRVCGVRLCVRGVPANVSAAEVHELCARCVATTTACTAASATAAARDEATTTTPRAVADDGHVAVVSCVVCYVPSTTTTNSAAAATADNDGHRSDTTTTTTTTRSERAFEVTFVSAQRALRAMTQLRLCAQRATASQWVRHVTAEPVVTAEVQQALQQLQQTQQAQTHA